MTTQRFKQVDVFTQHPFKGNPVAVVFDADDLTDAQMQSIAAWTNLSETTFLQRPTSSSADYRLRIFHPTGELPFAGHPTVGSAHAAVEAGLVTSDAFVQECGAGLLPLRREADGRIFVRAPDAAYVHEYSTSLEAFSAALGAPVEPVPPPATIDNGPVWLFCRIASPELVSKLQPDMAAVARLSRDFGTGFAAFALTGSDPAVHIRCFAPAVGVPEDPVTGSANAALPLYLARHGLLERTGPEYTPTQGTELGRDGRVFVNVLDDEGHAEIGGHAVTVIDGKIRV